MFIFLFKLSKHNIYLTVKFTNKIHPPPFFLFFLFKSMINNIPESNKWINKKYDRQNHVWSFMTKYLRFLCKVTSWSGETPTVNFRDIFLSWTKFYCIYQYFMSINSFFNTVSVSRYSRPITVTRPVTQISTFHQKLRLYRETDTVLKKLLILIKYW
jgi:hypothetical protein